MTLDLEAIKARLRGATSGPWEPCKHVSNHKPSGMYAANTPSGYAVTVREPGYPDQAWIDWHGNEDFIAHARIDTPDLIAEVERLTSEIGRLHTILDDEVGWHGKQNRRLLNALVAVKVAAEQRSASHVDYYLIANEALQGVEEAQ